MYAIYDKALAIREIQRYLLLISEEEAAINEVPVDGIYGEATRNAVSEFQKISDLPQTGTVDRLTFDMLYLRALSIERERDASLAVTEIESFPLKLGDKGSDVERLNITLIQLSQYYIDMIKPESGAFFSRLTEESVKEMQRTFFEEESGIVSKRLFERLMREVRAREKIKNL